MQFGSLLVCSNSTHWCKFGSGQICGLGLVGIKPWPCATWLWSWPWWLSLDSSHFWWLRSTSIGVDLSPRLGGHSRESGDGSLAGSRDGALQGVLRSWSLFVIIKVKFAFRWRFGLVVTRWLDQRSCFTSGPVSTGIGGRSRVYIILVFNQATQAYSAWPSFRG